MKPKRVGIFFVDGNRFLKAEIVSARRVKQLAKLGADVLLPLRGLHARSHEHCTRPCCAHEEQVSYRVFGITHIQHPDALMRVCNDRQWEEGQCPSGECSSLFDTYTLSGYLRGDGDLDFAECVIVDVASLSSQAPGVSQ